jgi:pimeloyl-ACP methyl ester carboxylesterase
MLHEPVASVDTQKIGIILLNAGLTDRAGPQQLYSKLARRLSRQGYYVLRFDARGVGESQGDWSEEMESAPVGNVFTRIQQGIWVPDAHAAITFMVRATGMKGILLGGLCGGAMTALLAGANHPLVDGLFLIGTPVTLSSPILDITTLPDHTIRRDALSYLMKLLSPSAWARFLTLRTGYTTLCRVLASRVGRVIRGKDRPMNNPCLAELNASFVSGFEDVVAQGKQLLFIYGENDYVWHEFKEGFLSVDWNEGRRPFDLEVIPQANHNLTEDIWQERLYSILDAWLAARSVKPCNGGRDHVPTEITR